MKFHVIIPARFASMRLPGKVLLDIAGKPMVQHVYERAKRSQATSVMIATDDEQVVKACQAFTDEVCLTAKTHHSGTERIAEVLAIFNDRYADDDIIVNVQADEPLIPIEVINQAAEILQRDQQAEVATLYSNIVSADELFDPNIVKVVMNNQKHALYFSRAPIPWARNYFNQQQKSLPEAYLFKRHVGIYAQRVSFIKHYVQWDPSPLEQLESLEQLRVLWHGAVIALEQAKQTPPHGVDNERDLQEIRAVVAALSAS